tara:strand:+ start:23333 stop:24001 length:669 start_codon:yes stop_codon:yes gene_type:complete
MGHPKFARPKTDRPTHPWKEARIEEEHRLKEQFGLKKVGGMKEIWREKTALRRHRNQAMKLIGRVDSTEGHYAREKEDLLVSLNRKGLLHEDSTLDDVLSITVEQMLSRRLQSVVYFKGLAPSMRSARSLIVHGHISIGDQRMTVPGYKILRSEEEELGYSPGSPYIDPHHAFRKEMEERRMPGSSPDDQDQPDADAEFVEQIKADAEEAPTIEDTIPKEGE